MNGSGTLRIGELAGVSIRVHFTFVILFIVLLFSSTGSPVEQAVYMFALFASVVFHELGHASVCYAYGIKTTEIVMFPVGGVAARSTKPTSRQDLWISLAGPFVNLVIACGLLLWRLQTLGWLETIKA